VVFKDRQPYHRWYLKIDNLYHRWYLKTNNLYHRWYLKTDNLYHRWYLKTDNLYHRWYLKTDNLYHRWYLKIDNLSLQIEYIYEPLNKWSFKTGGSFSVNRSTLPPVIFQYRWFLFTGLMHEQ